MNDFSLQRLFELSVLSPDDSPELISIYRASIDRSDLAAVDYLTIRDLLIISGLHLSWVHLLLIILFDALSKGNVCLELSRRSLEKKVDSLGLEESGAYVTAILSGVDECAPLMHRVEASCHDGNPFDICKPLVLVDSDDGRFLYFQKYYAAERTLLRSLAARVSRPIPLLAEMSVIASAAEDSLSRKPLLFDGTPALLDDRQRAAVLLPALGGLSLISGGPGTGKTFIALTILRIMTRLGIPPGRIRLAAPTGRAAQRLTEAIQRGLASIPDRDPLDMELLSLRGTTLHRLLRYSPVRNEFLHNRRNRIGADLVILDEASMIDISLLAGLFESLEDGARLVMMGDRNQLPSVDAGAILADLIPDDRGRGFSPPVVSTMEMVFPGIELPSLSPPADKSSFTKTVHPLEDRIVILDKSYRSEKEIQTIAEAILSGDQDTLDRIRKLDVRGGLPESGVWRIEPGTIDPHPVREIRILLGHWAERHYIPHDAAGTSRIFASDLSDPDAAGALDDLIASLDRARILTPLRSGITGTSGINALLSEKIGPVLDPSGTDRLFSGMPIMITRNDYARELFNGDTGILLKGRGGDYYAAFSRIDGPSLNQIESLPPYETAFAITVHKSQGSEYGQLILMLPDSVPETMLTAELIYTALTRGKNLVILYASGSAISRAVRNRTTRVSRLRLE